MSRKRVDPDQPEEGPPDETTPGDGWPTHGPRPEEPWDEITFANELSRLVRRLAAWEGVDFRNPVYMLDPGSPEIFLRNQETFREAVQRFSGQPRPRPAIIIASPPRDGQPGQACVEADNEADKPSTLWLMADVQRNLEAAAHRAVFDNLRLLFDQLLEARAWAVVPGQGGFLEKLLLAGRQVNRHHLTQLEDATKRLRDSAIDTPVRVVNNEIKPRPRKQTSIPDLFTIRLVVSISILGRIPDPLRTGS